MWGTYDGPHDEEESPGPCAAAPEHRQTMHVNQWHAIITSLLRNLLT